MVGFDDTFNVGNHISSIISTVRVMIGWVVRNFMSRKVNIVLIYKTLKRPHKAYSPHAWAPVSRHGNWSVILRLDTIQRRVTKIIKM